MQKPDEDGPIRQRRKVGEPPLWWGVLRPCCGLAFSPTSRVARSVLAFDQPAATLFPLMAIEATYVFPTTTQEMSR